MIPEKDKDILVDVSVSFMQTVSEIYGAEKGMELWATIADTIDPELKGEVFMAMLTGNYRRDKVTVKQAFIGSVSNKVGLIKCIRTYDKRGLSLKEAKDIADTIINSNQQVVLEVEPNIRSTFVVELRKLNMMV